MMDQRAPQSFTPREVARALGGECHGDNVLAPGPGHSKQDRSLSVTIDRNAPDGFYCNSFAGDDWQTCRDFVAERLGLPKWEPNPGKPLAMFKRPEPRQPMPDVQPERDEPFYDAHLVRKGYVQSVAYPYTDEAGQLLYEVLRYDHPEEGKTFMARRPGANGAWLKGAGERRVLYRAGDRSKVAHTTAFITEGEKDADRLASLGMLACTVAFGKWSPEAAQALAGYECFILEDNDEAGQKKARTAAQALAGVAASARIVRLPGLPEKGDVSDWLDAGGDPGQLLTICRTPAPGETPAKPIKATPFKWIDPATVPQRRWIYGFHYVRKFVSTTIAPGGVGKTALGIVEGLAIATGRDLIGVMPAERTNVWIWNGEDPLEELQRRVISASMHYQIEPREFEGRLFVDSGRDTEICIAEQTGSGTVINAPAVDQIKRAIRENDIGLIIIDPFVSSHRVTENDNNAIDRVAKTWAQIADETGCAVDLVHHSRKTGGNEVTVEDGRGAVALLGAARSARVLNPMTADEAEKAEVENRRLFFRVENGKANLTVPVDKATWHRLASVDLGNGGPGRYGDSVGVVTAWEWPDAMAGVTVSSLRAVQQAVSAGRFRESVQARDWVGKAVAEVMHLDLSNKAQRSKVNGLLKIWLSTGALIRADEMDDHRELRSYIKVGEWAND